MSKKITLSIFVLFWAVMISALFFIGADDYLANMSNSGGLNSNMHHGMHPSTNEGENGIIPAHQGLNQEPTEPLISRDGNNVYIKMTAQITDINIRQGYTYKAWTFNGQAPGPLVVVNEGDTIHFTLDNMDPAMPHSMDFHAVHAAPDKGFADVEPNEDGTFVYDASSPGVFMYHCGTGPAILHIANGMHGMIIVKPENGYPTDDEVDREFIVIQNEWYNYNDIEDMTNGNSSQVVFSTKKLTEDQLNTNGIAGALIHSPFQVKTGEKVRIYVANMGPNETSSFHVIGSLLEDVYMDGNPANHFKGMQTVLLPASGGAIVEFTLKEAGEYKFVSHQFNQVQKGAAGKIIAYDGEIPDLTELQNDTVTENDIVVHATNFTYDQSKYVVQSGEEVTISLISEEGYHGLSIDEFDVRIQGQGSTSFTPTQPGEYKIYCNVYCGNGHEQMTATLIVK